MSTDGNQCPINDVKTPLTYKESSEKVSTSHISPRRSALPTRCAVPTSSLQPGPTVCGPACTGRVLSVQSHVSRDYVGNRACALTMELLGIGVDIVNTVNFSSMYVHEGPVLAVQDLETILKGLRIAMQFPKGAGTVGGKVTTSDPEVLVNDIPIVVAGYVGSQDLLESLCNFLRELRQAQQRLTIPAGISDFSPPFFIMDPVMGDNARQYVPQEVVLAYREALRHADLITPNEYELQWLTGNGNVSTDKEVRRPLRDVLEDIDKCHGTSGPRGVFVTSCKLREDEQGTLAAIVSLIDRTRARQKIIYCTFPHIDCYLGGCGDVLVGLVVHEIMQGNFQQEKLASTIQRVLQKVQNLIRASRDELSVNIVKFSHLLRITTVTVPEEPTLAGRAASPPSGGAASPSVLMVAQCEFEYGPRGAEGLHAHGSPPSSRLPTTSSGKVLEENRSVELEVDMAAYKARKLLENHR